MERHIHAQFPHPEAEARSLLEVEGRWVERVRSVDEHLERLGARLSRLERFQYMLWGGMVVVSVLLGGGALTFLLHLFSGR